MTIQNGKVPGKRWMPALLWLLVLAVPEVMRAGGPYQFYSVTPCRIVDTRGPTGLTGGPALTSGVVRSFPIDVAPAACGIPSTAKAATLNVTFVGPTRAGYLTIWPFNTPQPVVSTVNANAGEPAIANGAIVPLTVDPNFNISVFYGTNLTGTANVIIDITGYLL